MEANHPVVQRSRFIAAMTQANGGVWPDLEELVAAVYGNYVRPGDLVFDVGVNHGVHLVRLAQLVGATGGVIGVEAVPAFLDHARRQVEALGPVAKGVALHQCAVAAEVGVSSFFVTSITDGGLSGLRLRPVIASDTFQQIEVETKTLDMLLPAGRSPRFVKIDIEGGEYDALRGAPRLLGMKPLIAFEFDASAPDQFGFDPQAFVQLLWDAGYAICDIFGFEVLSGADLMEAAVWNFLAVPAGSNPVSATAPARRILEARFSSLRAMAPAAPSPSQH